MPEVMGASPEMELLFACLETLLHKAPAKKRVAFIKALLERLERPPGAPIPIGEANATAEREAAKRAVRERLPRLLGP